MLVRFNNNPRTLLDNVFDNFFRSDVLDDGTLGLSSWTPAVDITEQENEYLVKVELPGIDKDGVRIMLESNVLTIRGEKKQDQETKTDGYHRLERAYGTFQRSFRLPSTVRVDKIDAVYKDGVLTIMLPKAEEAKPKQIEVKVK